MFFEPLRDLVDSSTAHLFPVCLIEQNEVEHNNCSLTWVLEEDDCHPCVTNTQKWCKFWMRKDTFVWLLFLFQWPESSELGQTLRQWAGKESHGEPSATEQRSKVTEPQPPGTARMLHAYAFLYVPAFSIHFKRSI